MMVGSSLPAQDDFEEQPARGEDYDFLSGWARSLSVSPRLFPTYGSTSEHGHADDLTAPSFSRGIGPEASPMLGPVRHDPLSLISGLSPLLGPTNPSSSGRNGQATGRVGTPLSPSLASSYDYANFGQYHTSPPLDPSPVPSHLVSRSKRGAVGMARRSSRNSSTHSFSNIDGLRSMSPHELPPPVDRQHSMTPKAEQDVKVEAPVEEEDPRIRAYAKLEFPTFDIYIQKLSVVIGRRPAAALAAATSAASMSNAPGKNGGLPDLAADGPSSLAADLESALNVAPDRATQDVKLEDFVVGMSEDEKKDASRTGAAAAAATSAGINTPTAAIKSEEVSIPLLSVTPSSQPPSPAPTRDAEATHSAPPPTAVVPAAPVTGSDQAQQSASAGASTATADVSITDDKIRADVAAPTDAPAAKSASGEAASDSKAGEAQSSPTDIDLGPIRAVSRQHARLYFDYDMASWAIEVLGRNGLVVEGKWIAKGEREPLGKRTRIQIAERIFHFVLPTIDIDVDPSSALPNHSAEGVGPEDESDEDEDNDGGDSSSLSEVSDDESEQPQNPSIPPIRIKVPARAGSSSGSTTPAATPGPARGATTKGYSHGGKKPEALQASRSGGKGKGSSRGKKGKGRRQSNASGALGEGDEQDVDGNVDDGDVDDMDVDAGGDSRTESATNGDGRRIVIKQHPTPKKQPKKDLQPAPSIASAKALDAAADSASLTSKPSDAARPGTDSGTAVSPAGTAATTAPLVPGAIPSVPGHPIIVNGVPMSPNGMPIKRGRGRPPKNGICAQRPRKPKPEQAAAQAAAAAKRAAASQEASAPAPVASTSASIPVTAPPPLDPAHMPKAAPADDLYTKPPYTYASLIAQAVMSSEDRKLTLNGIYDWITARWPYFSDNQNGWQNSIRHNLTLSRGFLKVARRDDEAGKGAFWTLDPAQVSNFDGLHFRKKIIKPATAPVSPKPTPPPKPMAAPPPKPVVKPPPPKPGERPPAPSLSAPLPIIVSPIPDSYVRPAPPPPSAPPPDELTAALLKDPPIVLHEGKLILNPKIFANLTKEQLDNLQVLPASQALQILQAYVVQHFKEKMGRASKERARAAAAARDAAAKAAAAKAGTSTLAPGPAPNVPSGSKQVSGAPVNATSPAVPSPAVTKPSLAPVAAVAKPAAPAQPPNPTSAPVPASVAARVPAPAPVTHVSAAVTPAKSATPSDDVVIVEPQPAVGVGKRKLDDSGAEAPATKLVKSEAGGSA